MPSDRSRIARLGAGLYANRWGPMDEANSGPDILDEMIKFSREVASAIAMMSLNHRYGVVKMSPFSAPFFWGSQERGLLLPKRAAALSEGTKWVGERRNRESSRREAAGPRSREGGHRINNGSKSRRYSSRR